jgi:hypothetical protein
MANTYDNEYYAVINDKLQNKKGLLSNKMNMLNKENKMTNKLLQYYDNNYNKYYDENQSLDNEIDGRERLIKINNASFQKKIDKVSLLKYFFGLLFYIFLVILGSYFKLYSDKISKYIIIIGTLIYIIVTYYAIYYENYTRGQYLATRFGHDSTSSFFKSVAREILPNNVSQSQCPKGCKPKIPTRCPKNSPNCINITPSHIRAMTTNNTLNKWKDGDILYQKCSVYVPTLQEKKILEKKYKMTLNNRLLKCPLREPIIDRETGEKIDFILFNSPEPWYSGIKNNINSNTIYTCEWTGTDSPIGDQGNTFSGYIPCKYFPGYKTKNVQIGNDKL